MKPSESKPNTKEVVEAKPVKEIAERAVSGNEDAGQISGRSPGDPGFRGGTSNRSRGNVGGQNLQRWNDPRVIGHGHDPQTTPGEPESKRGRT